MEKTKTPSQSDSSQKGEKSSPATLSHRIENAFLRRAATFRFITPRKDLRLLRRRRVSGRRSVVAPYPTAPSLPFPMFSDLDPDYHTPDYHTPLTDRNNEEDDEIEVLVPVR